MPQNFADYYFICAFVLLSYTRTWRGKAPTSDRALGGMFDWVYFC